jgi:acetyl-CoA acetyltransferase
MDLEEMRAKYPAPSGNRSVFMDHYAEYALPSDGVEVLGRIAAKNHQHGSLNPLAQFRHPYSAEEVIESRKIVGPLTLFMCSPLSDGAAAAVLMSDSFAGRQEVAGVSVSASVLVSGTGRDDGPRAVPRAVGAAYEKAGLGPTDLDLIELHDATALGEYEVYPDIGLCEPEDQGRLLATGEIQLGGRRPVNPSGGLIARGHPIGATGLAQIHELTLQLRGDAGYRQVHGARLGLAENGGGFIGTDSAAITMSVLGREELGGN